MLTTSPKCSMLPNEKYLYNLLRQVENRLADFKKADEIPEVLESAIALIFETAWNVLVRHKPLQQREISEEGLEGIVRVRPLPEVTRRLSEEEIEDTKDSTESWYS